MEGISREEYMITEEKVFPILRKLDYLWTKDPKRNLFDVLTEVCGGELKYITDEELEQRLKGIDLG